MKITRAPSGNRKPVTLRHCRTGELKYFTSRTEAARFLGVRVADVTNTLTGRQGSVRGFTAHPF